MNSPTPIDPTQPVLPPAPWYESPVQVRLVAAGISQVISIAFRTVNAFGFTIEVGHVDVDAVGADLAQGIAGLALAWAWWKRQRSKIQPLTMTAKQAEDLTRVNPPVMASDPTKVGK